ncbi:hypothetical protein SprV_0401525900 [Sparganum proliferum]
MNVLTPVQTHLQPIEAKRAMLILDDLVTKVLLVGAFPKILSNIETFALLVGDEATNIFRKLEPLAKELDEGITPGSSLRISELTGSTANQWAISDPVDAFFNPPKNRLAMVKDTVFSLSRHLIRSLMSNKEACFALLRHYKQWDVEACPAIKHLGSLLVQMRFLVRQALLTTTREKTMREEYQNKTERRMRRQARLIEEMTNDLSNQTEEHNKMAKLDSVTAEYEKEHKLHCQLKERFAPIKKEYDEICEIRRKEEEERRKEQEEKEEMIRAATFIQNFWRTWKTRKLLKAHKKVNIG